MIVALMIGCGSGSPPATPVVPTPAPTPTPTPGPAPPTVSITSAGLNPREIEITVGSRVTFVNNDALPHDFSGGPDPTRPQCVAEIDAVGFITAGQTKQTGVFTTAQTCEYHDHARLGVVAFQGRITVR